MGEAAASPPPEAVVQLPNTAQEEQGAEVEGTTPIDQDTASQNDKEEASEAQSDEKGSKKKSKKKNFKASTGGRSGAVVDVLSDIAQHNAHYTCHSVQDLLACRGYPWPLGQGSKGKK